MAKKLFDAARNISVSQGLNAGNKRTAIDVKMMFERMSWFQGDLYWTNTLQHVRDGLTIVHARQRSLEIMRRACSGLPSGHHGSESLIL